MRLRHVCPSDYERILAVIDEWWDGRPMSARLSHVFFSHVTPISFVLESGADVLAGFLLGFLSQTKDEDAYIHFVGVDPHFRRLGLGRSLYERLFTDARMLGRTRACSVTALANRVSIAFHRRMGFELEPGDGFVDDLPVRLDFAGPGGHRVLFRRRLDHDARMPAPAPWLPSAEDVGLDEVGLARLVRL